MTKKHGLVRSDGQPARQFGEEIIEPGEKYSDETLDVIRTLLEEHDVEPEAVPEPRETVLKSQSEPQIETTLSRAEDVPNDVDRRAVRSLLHFAEKQADTDEIVPTDWVCKVQKDAKGSIRSKVFWHVDHLARVGALALLAVVAIWVF